MTPSLNDIWRPARVFGRDFPGYEINLIQEVRRVTPAPGAKVGKLIGYSKDGTAYPRLGLRLQDRTYFVPRRWVAEETFPEVSAVWAR